MTPAGRPVPGGGTTKIAESVFLRSVLSRRSCLARRRTGTGGRPARQMLMGDKNSFGRDVEHRLAELPVCCDWSADSR